jgi:hypothetical protein
VEESQMFKKLDTRIITGLFEFRKKLIDKTEEKQDDKP